MAETKTNIPVEIKMGNAGTNDANLPAFKEGSIIFTKDTKKIYIDPVGETERIAVGGGEVDLSGKQDVFSVVEGKKVEDNVTIVLKDFEYFDKTLKELIKASKSTDSVQIQLPKDARNMLGGIKQIHNGEIGSSTVEVVFGNGTISLIGAAGGKVTLSGIEAGKNVNDAVNVAQLNNKQDKFAEYTSTRPSEEAPASDSTNILVLNEGKDFYLRDRATNPLVEFKINSFGALEGTTNYFSLTSKGTFNLKSNTFTLSNDKDILFQVVMDNSKKVVYYGLSGGDDNGSLYLTSTSRTGQQGATLQGNVSSDSRTTALVVNESNTKLLSWKQGTTTNNAPLLGVATPVATADTSKGITADDLDYQAVNKKYVDDAIGNITALFASLVDMTKTTQADELTDDTEVVNEPTVGEGGLN